MLYTMYRYFTIVTVIIRYIIVPTNLDIYLPAYFHVAKQLQHSPCYNLHYFLRFRAFKVDVEHHILHTTYYIVEKRYLPVFTVVAVILQYRQT